MTPAERFKEARNYIVLTQKELGEKLGFQWHKIKDIEAGKLKVTPDIAEYLENYYSISGWWLLTGKGEMLLKDNNLVQKNETKLDSNLVTISYFKDTYAAAGAGAINYDKAPKVMTFDKEFLRVQLGITVFKHLHIIHAIGNSMHPTIQTGEMLFINPFENEDFKIRDKDIYVINTPNGVLVKRIKIHPIKPIYILVSDNPEDEDIILEGDEFNSCTVIGRVIGHFNKL
ncbi:XRE family transcriptional regulator [Arcobacter sp. L]|uniref:LexA family transcriptional regulator n=1 Tax=Arcobacter sp. L TaxID=944547 RepID=UPI000229646F|nr:XRE family transcriptional regulator [Arcobacter sp. L]BAK73719.1 phage repressor protein [Arcobacter sp. L]